MTTTTENKASQPLPGGILCPDPPVAVDCPPCCTIGPGHPYELIDEEQYDMRWHRLTFGDHESGTLIEVGCEGTWRGESEELAPLDVRMWLDGDCAGPGLSGERAATLGGLLLEAVGWIRQNGLGDAHA